MNEPTPPTLRLVKSREQVIAELISTLGMAAMTYYLLHPDCVDDVKAWARKQWNRVAYRVAVWSTRQAIWSLPETDEEH